VKVPPPRDDGYARSLQVPSDRDRRFLIFVGAVLVAVALGFKSELIAQGQLWGLAGGLLLLSVPALLGYLRTGRTLPAVEHYIPAAIGAVAVAGLAGRLANGGPIVPQWWEYGAIALGFGLTFYLSGQLDYRRLRNQEKPGHVIVQEALLAVSLAAAYLVILLSPFQLSLKLGWIFVMSLFASYRSFRVLGKPFPPRRALLFSIFVAQVVVFFAWALSLYDILKEGVFAVMLLLAWYINRGLVRHTVEETLNRQVLVEYGAFGAVLAYLFITSYQPH
jgi:hypothetical protein